MNATEPPVINGSMTIPIPIPPPDMIDWNAGQSMSYGWSTFQLILFPTFALNTAVVTLIVTSDKLNSSSSGRIVKYLCLQDATFSILCAIQCTLNAATHGIWKQQVGCDIQSIYAMLLALSIGCTLALVSYNSHRLVRLKAGLTPRQVFRFHVIVWCICFVIAYACGAIIDTAPLIPSSLYCFVTLLNWKQGLVFFVPVSCIVAFIIHRYFMLFLYIRRAAESSHFSDAAFRAAHERQLKAAKRMVLLIVLFLVTVIPWVIVSIVEVTVQQAAPGMVHLLVGVSVHLNSLFDPIVYLAMTKPAQERVYEILLHFKAWIQHGAGYQRHITMNTGSVSPPTNKREFVSKHQSTSTPPPVNDQRRLTASNIHSPVTPTRQLGSTSLSPQQSPFQSPSAPPRGLLPSIRTSAKVSPVLSIPVQFPVSIDVLDTQQQHSYCQHIPNQQQHTKDYTQPDVIMDISTQQTPDITNEMHEPNTRPSSSYDK